MTSTESVSVSKNMYAQAHRKNAGFFSYEYFSICHPFR